MMKIAVAFTCVLFTACTAPTAPEEQPDASTTTPDGSTPQSVTLPFAVDDFFGPSGYMGDGEVLNAVTDTACATRGGDGRGNCHHFSWTPATAGWAGVYWQYPDGNWGTLPGLEIPAGATQISFYAWGAAGGEPVSFMVGMTDVDEPLGAKSAFALTTTPTKYTLSVSAQQYTDVVGGFGWTAEGATSKIEFFVDDIIWE